MNLKEIKKSIGYQLMECRAVEILDIDSKTYWWFIEQAEKVKRYEEVLNFYANEENHESPIFDEHGQFNGSLVDRDCGEKARISLGIKEN